MRAEVPVANALRVRVGVENLLDTEFHEHLTREAIMAVDDLAAGDEIAAPGRSLQLALVAEIGS